MSIIISKTDKPLYNTPKIFQLIILLDILKKLIKKAISGRFQVYFIVLNFIYLNQMRSIKQQSTTDASVYLIYLIKAK